MYLQKLYGGVNSDRNGTKVLYFFLTPVFSFTFDNRVGSRYVNIAVTKRGSGVKQFWRYVHS